ncbi:MAG: helix-turn-helix transcriptional regulator [Clostridia bacterium]|nr:helix-turn-helix transcriptional regulator [Clostridia bacterium]
MLKIDVERLLKEKGKTKYWLWKQTNLTYTNFDNLIKNRTISIRYENLEKLCDALECTPNDLFVKVKNETQKSKKNK